MSRQIPPGKALARLDAAVSKLEQAAERLSLPANLSDDQVCTEEFITQYEKRCEALAAQYRDFASWLNSMDVNLN